MVVGFLGASLLNYSVEGKQRRFIKSVFRHYLSPDVIEKVIENPSLLQAGRGEAGDHLVFLRRRRVHVDLGSAVARGAGQPAQRVSLGDDRHHPLERRDSGQVRGGRHHRLLERAPRPARPRPEGLPGGAGLPEAAGRASAPFSGKIRPGRGHAHRAEFRSGGRREHGLDPALRLHGHGRHHQPGGPAGRRLQTVQSARPHRGDNIRSAFETTSPPARSMSSGSSAKRSPSLSTRSSGRSPASLRTKPNG